jgi:tetratricopeptide (TPR) repeat protein
MSDRSVRAGDISQSVVVTGDGNAVTLTFGASGVSIPLIRKQFPPPERRRQQAAGEPARELDILVPETLKLPLIGRQEFLAELRTWLEDEVDISVQALIGPAGSGKSRLAIGLCQAIDGDFGGKGEWIAGFLSPGDLTPVVDTLATHAFDWTRPTLLVIDNAAQGYRVLARWLDRLSSQKLSTKLRMLLLDREAPEGFGWWHELTGSGLPARRDLFSALRPRRLPELPELDQRRELISSALEAAAKLRPGVPNGLHIPARDEDRDFDRRLAEPQFGSPLALVMAGLIALDRGPQGALALRHLGMARQLGRRELDRMAALAESRRVSGDAARHIVAFNGLVGGMPVAKLRQIVPDELAASHRTADLDALLDLLEQELPPRQEAAEASSEPRLATIRPDLIGEAAIIEAFTGRASSEAEAAEVVRRAYGLSFEEAARVLVRLVQDFGYPLEDEGAPDEEKATARRVIDWLASLMLEPRDPEQMLPLVFALPEQTTILREPAAELTQRLVSHFRELAARSDEPAASILLASLLNNLAVRLRDLGRREQALAAAEEAVGLRRPLAADRPDAFTPDLARSLNNLANTLSELGRREQALAAAEEAVRLRRVLAAARPDAFTPDLALSLNNLGNRLSELGRREEALAAAEEAVGLYRALAATRPDAFTPNLALSLTNLAHMLSELGRREQALAAAEEAVGLYRALAAARPDAFTPHLALSLSNFGNMLSALGRREQALSAAEEAVRLCRVLAAARPEAFTPDLATSLNNLGLRLSDLGRHEEALAAAEEAVGLRRALAATHSEAFTPDLASSLNNLGLRLSELGRREQALAATEEAVRLRRILAAARPDAFTPNLAGSLSNLAHMLSGLGRREQALAAAEEALGLRRALAAARPDAFTPDLALSLNNLGNRLSDLGRREEALAAAEEAVGLYRALAAARSDAFAADLARSLWVLGDLYSKTGKTDLAIETLAEGMRVLTPMFVAVPAAVAGMMSGLVQSYMVQCETAGREPDTELLRPVIEEFERLNATEENK